MNELKLDGELITVAVLEDISEDDKVTADQRVVLQDAGYATCYPVGDQGEGWWTLTDKGHQLLRELQA